MPWARALSIGRPTYERLQRLREHRPAARVLAVFKQACDLVIPRNQVFSEKPGFYPGRPIHQVGRTSGHATAGCAASHLIIALVTPQIGDGPLNIVLDGAADPFAGVLTGAAATLSEERIEIGELRLNLAGATVWEPRPDWDALRTRRAAIISHLPALRDACLRGDSSDAMTVRGDPTGTIAIGGGPADSLAIGGGPADSFLSLLRPPRPEGTIRGAILSRAAEAAQALGEGWAGDRGRLRAGATALAGLGGGLTPAGDDFLVGAMLGAWLTHPTPASLCRVLADAAAPRTTILSAAFLRAAARGECSAAWHTLLAALSRRPDRADASIRSKTCQVYTAAVRSVMAHGATSGADALAGFLFVCQRQTGQRQTLRVSKTLRVSGRDIHSKDYGDETNLS